MKNVKKIVIFEPAMCCPTGVCGPSVNSDLLEITALANSLAKDGIVIERFNPTSNPQAFLDNKKIKEIINKDGIETLPITMVDDEIVKTKQYPSSEEIMNLLGLPVDYAKNEKRGKFSCCGEDIDCNPTKDSQQSSCCSGGGCC